MIVTVRDALLRSGHMDDLALESVLRAFGSDVSYAVAMINQAQIVQNKRDLWSARKTLKGAAKQAQAQCAARLVPRCTEPGPCGTGSCRFALPEFRNFHARPSAGPVRRPVPSMYPSYDPEASVPLMKQYLAERGGNDGAIPAQRDRAGATG